MDKQAKIKSIMILVLFAVFLSLLIYAAVLDTPDSSDIQLTKPANNYYVLNDSVEFIVNVSAVYDWNVSQLQLFWNASGSFIANSTQDVTNPTNNTAVGANFTFAKGFLPDGSVILWNWRINFTNASGGGSEGDPEDQLLVFGASNRTFQVQYPPSIALNSPSNSATSGATDVLINFTVTSIYTNNPLFDCQLWSNETGSWIFDSTAGAATNNTPFIALRKQFNQLQDIRWAVKCFERSDSNVYGFSANNTISIDRTAPVVTITLLNETTISSGTYLKTLLPKINYTVTETNLHTCRFFVNNTVNQSDTSTTAGARNLTFNALSDGVYQFLIGCNDTSNNQVNSSAYIVTLDTATPLLSQISNFTLGGYSDRRVVNFTINEEANATVFYGTTVGVTSNVDNNSYLVGQTIQLKNLDENYQYYFNITVCDRAGNCNISGIILGQATFRTPFKVNTGWNYFAVYDSLINFSTILNATGAEYVYFWNQTRQEWIFATQGSASNGDFQVGTNAGTVAGRGRHVVALYESVNGTWNRNTSAGGNVSSFAYIYNITTGDNFLKIPRNMTLGQLSESFLNGTVGTYGITLQQTPVSSFLTYNLTRFYFATFNRTAVDWTAGYVYNFSYNNRTYMENVSSFGEVAWLYSPYNLTWNTSQVLANWTI